MRFCWFLKNSLPMSRNRWTTVLRQNNKKAADACRTFSPVASCCRLGPALGEIVSITFTALILTELYMVFLERRAARCPPLGLAPLPDLVSPKRKREKKWKTIPGVAPVVSSCICPPPPTRRCKGKCTRLHISTEVFQPASLTLWTTISLLKFWVKITPVMIFKPSRPIPVRPPPPSSICPEGLGVGGGPTPGSGRDAQPPHGVLRLRGADVPRLVLPLHLSAADVLRWGPSWRR